MGSEDLIFHYNCWRKKKSNTTTANNSLVPPPQTTEQQLQQQQQLPHPQLQIQIQIFNLLLPRSRHPKGPPPKTATQKSMAVAAGFGCRPFVPPGFFSSLESLATSPTAKPSSGSSSRPSPLLLQPPAPVQFRLISPRLISLSVAPAPPSPPLPTCGPAISVRPNSLLEQDPIFGTEIII